MFYNERTDSFGDTYLELNKKKVGIAVGCGVLCLISILILCLSICRVPTGHSGVVVSFGRVEEHALDSGLNIKAPWKRVKKMDNRVQKKTIEITCFSADTQEVRIVYTLNYALPRENTVNIYKTVGKDYCDILMVPNINEATKVVTAVYTAEKLVASREELAVTIEKNLADRLTEFGIQLVSTAVEDMDFTDAYTNAVEAKQVAHQNKLKAETEAEQRVLEANAAAEVARVKAQGEADAKKIAAEAEAAANKMISESLDKNVLTNKWYEKWNGEYPQVVSDSGSIIQFPIGEE